MAGISPALPVFYS